MKKFSVEVQINTGVDIWTVTNIEVRTIEVEADTQQIAWYKVCDILEEENDENLISSVLLSSTEVK